MKRGDSWDPRTYVSVSWSYSSFGKGKTISQGGGEQETSTFFDLGGISLDIQIGFLPDSCDLTGEMGIGLGNHLGVGYFFGRPDALGNMQVGGLAFHFGIGAGSPLYISGTYPKGVSPK